MRAILSAFLLIVLCNYTNGQVITKSIPLEKNGDTSFFYSWNKKMLAKAELKNLENGADTLHFRFTSDIQVIDIWTSDYSTFSGMLTNYTTKYQYKDSKKDQNVKQTFLFEKKVLDTNTSKRIYELFIALKIFTIPSQDSIPAWTNGLDGNMYYVEHFTNNAYSFKHYWTPYIFKDKIEEARRINELSEKLELLLKLNQSFTNFINSLPKGSYSSGGALFTKSSKRLFKKNRP
jgi:hypothetical protein